MKIFAEIAKIDEEQRLVMGYASTEAMDKQGEIVKLDAIKAALPDYLEFGNIREMHQPSAVGIAKGAEVDETGLYLTAKVVDDAAWTKVKEGVYKGFSIGGKVTARDAIRKNVVTGVDLMEISLVDRPANPEAKFDMFKAEAPAQAEPPKHLLKQAWTCCHPDHEHLAKAEAVACIEATPEAERTEEARIAKREAMAKAVAAPAEDPLKKGMYQVAWLADLVSSLDCLQSDSRWEAMMEGDGSTVPAKLKEAVDNLTGILKEMVAEEAAEIAAASAEAETDTVVVIEAAAKPADLAKKDEAATPTAEDLAKAALAESIQKAVADALAPLKAQNEALEKRLEELAAEPKPAKGVAKAIEKGGAAEPTDEELMAKFAAMSPDDQTKWLVKAALRNPQPIGRHPTQQ